jgi:hypothetical protein
LFADVSLLSDGGLRQGEVLLANFDSDCGTKGSMRGIEVARKRILPIDGLDWKWMGYELGEFL